MRVAIYARYSTDRQNEASARDQIDRCRRHATERGWDVRETYSDEARRGTDADRPGFAALRQAVEAGRVDVVLVESLDRLSRTTSEAMGLIERFAFRGVGVIGIADGVDTTQRGGTLIAGIRATLAAEYLRDLGDKTRRGMQGRMRAGLATGALPYGYRSRPLDGGGAAIEIDPARADTIRRIFAAHAGGRTVREIARALNADGIEPPRARPDRRGSGWMHTSVRAILRNERYAGRWRFGVRRWEKEPGTGKRRVRAGIEPQVFERPELAIVDRATFDRVASRFSRSIAPRRRVVHLLSGLLRCGPCGTAMTINGGNGGRRYYTCPRARAGGGCSNGKGVLERSVRALVVDGIREMIDAHAEHVAELVVEELAAAAGRNERDAIAGRLRTAEAKIERLVDAVATGNPPAALVTRLRDLEAQAAGLRADLAAADRAEAAEEITVDELLARVRDVGAHLDGDPQVAREHLRDLVGGAIHADPEATGWTIRGALVFGALLDRQSPVEAGPGRANTVVAGARFVRAREALGGLLEPFSWRLAA
jgi:site-specific DNA recombinase